jgi:hypothetical protein
LGADVIRALNSITQRRLGHLHQTGWEGKKHGASQRDSAGSHSFGVF